MLKLGCRGRKILEAQWESGKPLVLILRRGGWQLRDVEVSKVMTNCTDELSPARFDGSKHQLPPSQTVLGI